MTATSSGQDSAPELRVRIDPTGDFPPGFLDAVDTAVHRAVLMQLAETNLGPGFRVTNLTPGLGAGPAAAAPGTPIAAAGDTYIGLIIVIK